jgi:hypothetical protein
LYNLLPFLDKINFVNHKLTQIVFSRSGVEINFSDVNIVTEVEHFLPREQIFANTCSLGSFHFFDSCDKNLMGVFIFFDCCDKNLIVLSRQLLIPLNSSKDDNSFVIIFLFLKFEIFVLFLLPTVKIYIYFCIFPSVLCIGLMHLYSHISLSIEYYVYVNTIQRMDVYKIIKAGMTGIVNY